MRAPSPAGELCERASEPTKRVLLGAPQINTPKTTVRPAPVHVPWGWGTRHLPWGVRALHCRGLEKPQSHSSASGPPLGRWEYNPFCG